MSVVTVLAHRVVDVGIAVLQYPIGCSPIIGFQEESDEDLVGLLEESDRKKSGKLRFSAITHGNSVPANRKREEDDSDEDLLRV